MAKASGRPPRSAQENRDIQKRIASHASRLFREEGFGAVSMRRLAKEAGCSPMTLYAHFDGKTDILRYLWGDVLGALFEDMQRQLEGLATPALRLAKGAEVFVRYWLENPEHFRLVFMSNDVNRSDVKTFVEDADTMAHFRYFTGLVQAALPEGHTHKTTHKPKADALIAGLIGIALCANTIRDYSWTDPIIMSDNLVMALLKDAR